MKKLKNLLSVITLTLILASSAFAGDIHTGIVSPPPDSGGSNIASTSTVTAATTTSSNNSASDPVTNVVLTILHAVFGI